MRTAGGEATQLTEHETSVGSFKWSDDSTKIFFSATDKRETTFSHDVRGWALLQTNPETPHVFNKYDIMGRRSALAQYSATASSVE